ncbi:Ig-like domain-containing protein [Peribacillus tepidiphilus]|uniref:Ig-like domain-containing protein n=1 Tax=Peribacillus tepidiphilus TaxID=2652445 RepID=UPI0035B4FC6E
MKQAKIVTTALFTIMIILFSNNHLTFAKKWDIQTTDQVNKVWKVRFNVPLDQKSLTSDSFYVLNGTSKHSTTLRLEDSGYTVVVAPNSSYEIGKTYRIIITSLVKSKKGKAVRTPIEIPFQVVKTSSKIQSVNTFSSGAFTNITVTTSEDVYKVKIGADEMHYKGNNTFTYGLIDIKNGTTLTIYAYDENNKLIETKKYTVVK